MCAWFVRSLFLSSSSQCQSSSFISMLYFYFVLFAILSLLCVCVCTTIWRSNEIQPNCWSTAYDVGKCAFANVLPPLLLLLSFVYDEGKKNARTHTNTWKMLSVRLLFTIASTYPYVIMDFRMTFHLTHFTTQTFYLAFVTTFFVATLVVFIKISSLWLFSSFFPFFLLRSFCLIDEYFMNSLEWANGSISFQWIEVIHMPCEVANRHFAR